MSDAVEVVGHLLDDIVATHTGVSLGALISESIAAELLRQLPENDLRITEDEELPGPRLIQCGCGYEPHEEGICPCGWAGSPCSRCARRFQVVQ